MGERRHYIQIILVTVTCIFRFLWMIASTCVLARPSTLSLTDRALAIAFFFLSFFLLLLLLHSGSNSSRRDDEFLPCCDTYIMGYLEVLVSVRFDLICCVTLFLLSLFFSFLFRLRLSFSFTSVLHFCGAYLRRYDDVMQGIVAK
jgi:hypothetical protein